MDLNGQTANRVVKVSVTCDGLVQLYLDTLLIEMTPENFTNFEYIPAITEYKRGETKKNEQKLCHLVNRSEWPSQKIPEKICRTF